VALVAPPRRLPAALAEIAASVRGPVSSDGLAGTLHDDTILLGELSPGCRACQDGTWDCVFLTWRCNLECRFCISPAGTRALPDGHGSAFGTDPAEILSHYRRLGIAGVSFSGGDPFVARDRLFEWATLFKAEHPAAYYWVYTNGLLAQEDDLRRLAALGVDEIRFNLAATGYVHPAVLDVVRAAARHFARVTVEIPALPDEAPQLLAALHVWHEAGVRYLNLHELLYEPGSNSATLPGPRTTFCTPDGHESAFDPRSRELALTLLNRVAQQGPTFNVNFCSVQSKLRQLRGRRRLVGQVFKEAHEQLVGDELHSYCLFDERDTMLFVHPDALAESRRTRPELAVARLKRWAPLSPEEGRRWIAVEWVETPGRGEA
jgi:uncharacterized protein